MKIWGTEHAGMHVMGKLKTIIRSVLTSYCGAESALTYSLLWLLSINLAFEHFLNHTGSVLVRSSNHQLLWVKVASCWIHSLGTRWVEFHWQRLKLYCNLAHNLSLYNGDLMNEDKEDRGWGWYVTKRGKGGNYGWENQTIWICSLYPRFLCMEKESKGKASYQLK